MVKKYINLMIQRIHIGQDIHIRLYPCCHIHVESKLEKKKEKNEEDEDEEKKNCAVSLFKEQH